MPLNLFNQLISILLTIIIILCVDKGGVVFGYSQGAPQRACVNMVPGHGSDKQESKAPYEVVVTPIDKSSVSVSILTTNKNSLTGFMLQARNANNRNKIIDGTFSEDKYSQIKSCNSEKPNTLTHRSGAPKTRIDSQWTPPDDTFTGDVIFRATIVQTKQVFWTDQDSGEVVRFVKGQIAETVKPKFMNVNEVTNNEQSIDVLKTDQQMATSGQPNGLNYSRCSQHLCLGLGENVDCVQKKSCKVLLLGGFLHDQKGLIEFELSANVANQRSQWFSMGLSEDGSMGDDLVFDCFLTSDGKVKMSSSFNSGKTNLIIKEQNYMKPVSTNFANGLVSCKWQTTQQKIMVKDKEFDLLDKKYHLLIAHGHLEDDFGNKEYHHAKLRSETPINLEQKGIIGSKMDLTYLVRIHGSLMVISWIGLVSIAILLARHYKQVWVSNTLCGVKIWFAFHRGLMVTSLILMFLAQTCIFYYLGEYRVGGHQLFGSLAFVIAILQPIGALFRPSPDANNRWIFNWMHWLGGNIGHITACVAIFLATNLNLADLPKPFLWTMIAFVIFHVIIHIVLQFHAFLMQNRKTHDIALQDMNHRSHDQQMGSDSPGSGFRRFILGIYVVIVFCVVIALVSFISVSKKTLEKMAIT